MAHLVLHARKFCGLAFVWLVIACGGQTQVDLEVKLRTDYQPLREFISVEVVVDATPEERLATIDAPYVRPGQSLATFKDLTPADSRKVEVVLRRLGGGELSSTVVYIEHKKDLVLTVAITRNCAGKMCDPVGGLERRCLSGVCVDARCATGDEPYCEQTFTPCVDDAACTSLAACAKATCENGVCFSDAQNSLCETGEVCDIEQDVCVPSSSPGDCTGDGDCTEDDMSDGCMSGECVPDAQLCVYRFVETGAPPSGSVCETAGGVCQGGVCVLRCANGIQDGDETAIDCGGSLCAGCGLGQTCLGDDDCASGLCDLIESQTCEGLNVCGNGRVDAGEGCDDGGTTDGDGCDSACLGENGTMCTVGTDCAAGYCAADGTCRPASCDDTMLNGDETDVDCGGSCGSCAVGQMCSDDGDCAYSCTGGLCDGEPAHCADGMTSGDEVGADCGGSCLKTCVVYDCAAQTEIPLLECEKLKDLYNAADGPQWTNITGWFADNSPCSWTGITCTAVPGNVEELAVKEDNARGVIARGLDELASLTVLQISAKRTCCSEFNELGGTIPPEIGSLSNLRDLRISYTKVSGSIPVEFGTLSSLSSLNLSNNRLDGTIPATLGQIPTLRSLILHRNSLSGTIPVALFSSGALWQLLLSENLLNGPIPKEIANCLGLHNVQMNNNQLAGAIPSELWNLANLTNLLLRRNQLSGGLPSSISNLSKLTRLWLDSNQLTGSLPSSIGLLTKLNNVQLQSNMFTGAIPVELGDLVLLTNLDLSYNQLSGQIPTTVGNLSALTYLRLSSNMLDGALPAQVTELLNLMLLELDQNQLTGMVPTSITNLTGLTQLNLCPQLGTLTSDAATGTWMRSITNLGWSATDVC